MQLKTSDKKEILIIILDLAIESAKKRGIGLSTLSALKEKAEGKDFKKDFKIILRELAVQFPLIFAHEINLEKLFKFRTTDWEDLNNGKEINVELMKDYVKKQLSFLVQEALPSSSNGSKHTRRRSNTLEDPRSLYGRKRGISFYTPAPSSSEVPRLRLPEQVTKDVSETSLVAYFTHLLNCDQEKTAEFVIALIEDLPQLAWGVQVLNAASNKKTSKIAEILMQRLHPQRLEELANIFSELFKLEKKTEWCRGNQLFYTLKDCYFKTEEVTLFSANLWSTLFSLQALTTCIKVKNRESLAWLPVSFSAELEHIAILQNGFKEVLKKLISPDSFPPLMKQIIKEAYFALMNRSDFSSAEADTAFMSFVLLRFINSLLLSEVSQQPSGSFQMWCTKIFIPALQSLVSPIVISPVTNANTSASSSATLEEKIEKELGDEKLYEVLFGSIISDTQFRAELLTCIKSGLGLDQIVTSKPTYDDTQVPFLDEKQTIVQLNDLLVRKYSGYHFKSNGNVTPGRNLTRPSARSVFSEDSDSEDSNSANANSVATPRNG